MDTPESMIQEYLQQMSPSEKIAYDIAVKNLESSFDIEKSIGFKEFVEKKETQDEKTWLHLGFGLRFGFGVGWRIGFRL